MSSRRPKAKKTATKQTAAKKTVAKKAVTKREGINNPQLSRLVRRAAVPEVKRVSQNVYDALRVQLRNLLTEILHGSARVTWHLRTVTISAAHVDLWIALNGLYNANAYQREGQTLETFSFTKKRNKSKTKEIKSSLNKSILKPQPFRRLCREILSSEKNLIFDGERLRFARRALEALQFYTEAMLGEHIRAASLIALSAGRQTLDVEDLTIAAQIAHPQHLKVITAGPTNVKLATYIYKVLKQVHPDTGISGLAMRSIENLLNSVFSRIIAVSNALLRALNRSTLTSREIQSAVLLVLPEGDLGSLFVSPKGDLRGAGELLRGAISEGTRSVTKYNASLDSPRPGQPRRAAQSASARAGLTFPIMRFVTEARNLSFSKRVGKGSMVYLAAVMEYVCAEILDLAGNDSRADKKVRIATKHLHTAISNNSDLSSLFNGVLLGTSLLGVTENLQQ